MLPEKKKLVPKWSWSRWPEKTWTSSQESLWLCFICGEAEYTKYTIELTSRYLRKAWLYKIFLPLGSGTCSPQEPDLPEPTNYYSQNWDSLDGICGWTACVGLYWVRYSLTQLSWRPVGQGIGGSKPVSHMWSACSFVLPSVLPWLLLVQSLKSNNHCGMKLLHIWNNFHFIARKAESPLRSICYWSHDQSVADCLVLSIRIPEQTFSLHSNEPLPCFLMCHMSSPTCPSMML